MQRFQAGRGLVLLGAADDTATTGAAVVAYFASHPCTQDSVPEVVAFQTAWNASNAGDELKVDGEYGPLTQGALQNAMGSVTVPPNCFGGPTPPAPRPSPSPSPAPPAPSPSPSPSRPSDASPLPWLIGGAIVVTAFAAWTYSSKTRKRHRHV